MFLDRLSIQWKITLLAGLCLLAIVAVLIGMSLYRMSASTELVKANSAQMLEASARERMEGEGKVQALTIQRYFLSAYQDGLNFSRQVLRQRQQARNLQLDGQSLRQDLHQQVKAALRYPITVLVAISIAIGVLAGFVIPAFNDIFSKMGALGRHRP